MKLTPALPLQPLNAQAVRESNHAADFFFIPRAGRPEFRATRSSSGQYRER
jgi:hypothetical protein